MSESDAQFPELDEAVEVAPAKKPGRLATMLSLVAVLLSVVALCGVAWLAMQEPPPPPVVERDDSRVNSLAAAVDASETQVRDPFDAFDRAHVDEIEAILKVADRVGSRPC